MDMVPQFFPRKLANGALLRQMNNQNVSIMLRVVSESGPNLTTMSTDGTEVRVHLPNNEPIGARKGNWVEIIGKPSSATTLRANDAILFSDEGIDFDMEGYNMLVNFMNNVKDIYRSG